MISTVISFLAFYSLDSCGCPSGLLTATGRPQNGLPLWPFWFLDILQDTYCTVWPSRHSLLWWETTMTGTVGRWVIMVEPVRVYYVILAIFVMALLTAWFIRRSRFGLALQTIGEQEEAATHIGINATLLKTIAFAISAFFMGATGSIMATKLKYIDPRIAFDPLLSFMPVLMAIFGGTGQLYGPVFGAAIFAYLEEILTTKFPYYYMLLFGIILIVVILFLPKGLVGLAEKWRQGGVKRQHENP